MKGSPLLKNILHRRTVPGRANTRIAPVSLTPLSMNIESRYSSVLVLVHIGDHFPEYINTCIAQLQSVSPIQIHVLISAQHTSKLTHSVTIFPLESIPKTAKRLRFEADSQLDASSRGGFWRNAMMRFFYIYDHAVSHNITDIFHIEYDNLIYTDFTQQLPVFQTLPMWCVMDSPDRCIPSFLYFRNSSILSRLLDTCVQCAATGVNDMYAIGKFRNTYPNEVGTLPIINQYVEPIDDMYTKHAHAFTCLFDGAAIGQFIGGVDPRNIPGDTRGFINETTVIKCDKLCIEWNNKRPYLNGAPLVNLHIHSKDLKIWTSVECYVPGLI